MITISSLSASKTISQNDRENKWVHLSEESDVASDSEDDAVRKVKILVKKKIPWMNLWLYLLHQS